MLEEVFAGIFMSHSARWHGQDLQALATRFCSEWCSVAQAYYKLNYVDRQIASPEQRICEDLPAFCHGVADLSLEWVQSSGGCGLLCLHAAPLLKNQRLTAAIFAYVLGCGAFTSAFAPNFGKLFKRQSENEGASSCRVLSSFLACVSLLVLCKANAQQMECWQQCCKTALTSRPSFSPICNIWQALHMAIRGTVGVLSPILPCPLVLLLDNHCCM